MEVCDHSFVNRIQILCDCDPGSAPESELSQINLCCQIMRVMKKLIPQITISPSSWVLPDIIKTQMNERFTGIFFFWFSYCTLMVVVSMMYCFNALQDVSLMTAVWRRTRTTLIRRTACTTRVSPRTPLTAPSPPNSRNDGVSTVPGRVVWY